MRKPPLFLFLCALICVALSCGKKENPPQSGDPQPTPPLSLDLSAQCLSAQESAHRESNIFTCSQFASLRFSVTTPYASWFRRNTLPILRAEIPAEEAAYLNLRHIKKGKFYHFEIGVFFEENEEQSSRYLLGRLTQGFLSLKRRFRWKDSLHQLDRRFIRRRPRLRTRWQVKYLPEKPNRLQQQQSDILFRDVKEIAGSDERLNFWLEARHRLETLNLIPHFSDWLDLLDTWFSQGAWTPDHPAPDWARSVEFQLSYTWSSGRSQWRQAPRMTSPSQWRLERKLTK